MNIKIESPFVLEIELKTKGDEEAMLQRQVSRWLQRVYGATPVTHPRQTGPALSSSDGKGPLKVILAVGQD